jgi:hypothetical protein
MKALYDRLNDATVRMDQVLLLAGMLCDGDAVADPLRELLEDDPDTLKRCFPDMPAEFAEVSDTDEFKETFLEWAYLGNKWGFVVQFARPVMDWSADGNSAGFSWGYYNTAWFYGDTLDEAVERGLQWAVEREAAEKAKPKKSRTPQAA